MVECTLSITHCLRLNLQLHTIDLVRTCRISSFCTVAWQLARFQLTRRIARSLGDSWASCLDFPLSPFSKKEATMINICGNGLFFNLKWKSEASLGDKSGETIEETRSTAIAEGPRDASCQLTSRQLSRNSAETTCVTSPEQIEVIKLKGYSGSMCNKHVHSTMTLPLSYRCRKQTDYWPSCGYNLYLLWQNFLSPQCRNCLRGPDHAHLGSTHSSRD